jgi:Family of unknown function (DUF6467)
MLSGMMEPPMRHHPLVLANLTAIPYREVGPCQPVSFTGAVSSQRVTEEREGWLSVVGNHVSSALA